MRNYIDPLNDYSDFSFSKPQDITLDDLKANKYNVVLLTGIASPHQLESDFRQFCQFTPIRFEDHHNFTKKDIDLIASKTKQSESGNTIVVTTEKDAMRLIEYMRNNPGDDAEFIRNRYQDFYVLPVEVKFMKEKQDEFNQIIIQLLAIFHFPTIISLVYRNNKTFITTIQIFQKFDCFSVHILCLVSYSP